MVAAPDPPPSIGARHRGPSLVAVAIVFTTLFISSLIISTAMAGGEHFPSPFQAGALSYFADHAEAVRVGAFLQFGSAIPLGIFTATVVSLSVTGGLSRRLPNWLMWFGLAVAALAELSAFSLIATPATYLLPIARFSAFVWMICVGALLPKTRRQVVDAG